MVLLIAIVFLTGWWLWSISYKRAHKPVPVRVSPLGMREGNYAQAVPQVARLR